MVAWPVEPLNPNPSVLITDDSAAWRNAVGDILERAGFRAIEAASGEEAIEVVRTERLDIILMDFHMPRLDGIETLRIIRRTEHWLPAVLVTGHPEELPQDAVRALRVHTVLHKTADREVIVTTVTRVVRPEPRP